MKWIFVLLILLCPLWLSAQSILRGEYFYDTDPGVGGGIAITSFVPANIVNMGLNLPTTGLSPGSHILYVRTLDADGRWSLSEGRTITIIPSIVAAEYFYDTDLGVGNGTAIPLAAFADSVNFNATFPTTGLSTGTHTLYVRTKDTDGRWSLSEGRTITIVPSIVAAEYFYDTDLGVGNGTAIPLAAFADSVNFNTTFPTTGLTNGTHTLYVRTKDTDGRWSLSEGRTITIIPSIIAAEYFYDTDLGVGNGIAIPLAAFADSVNFNATFPTTGLSTGTHTLYVRTKDTEGRWSLSEARTITIIPSIVAAEYFYDTDLGVGNGVPIPAFAFADSVNFNATFPTTGLTPGTHTLYVRTKDTDGRWSLSEARTITIVPSIVAAEYFYDTDLGVGNGTPIPSFAFADSVNFNATIPTTGLTLGTHTLYVRTKDTDGRWSISEARTITLVPSIVASEYFYDTDPGVGNATPISTSLNADSVNFNYLFPTNHLNLGTHALYVRTRDSDGRWSLTEPRAITLTADSALLVRIRIEGFYSAATQSLASVLDPVNEPTICDQITISLAQNSAPYNIVFTQNTFLMTDGMATIVVPTGAAGNSYYIVVKHRNSLETWSKNPVTINQLTTFSF